VQPEIHWHGSPAWASWVTNIIGNVESARDALVDRGLCAKADIDAAVAELGALIPRPDASAVFVWNAQGGSEGTLCSDVPFTGQVDLSRESSRMSRARGKFACPASMMTSFVFGLVSTAEHRFRDVSGGKT
jgi:hypothetical protein